MESASKSELDRLAKEQQESKEDRVKRLLEDANKQFLAGQYAGSVERIDQAIAIDPANQAAIDLRDIADRARHNSAMEMHRERWRQEWNATILENQQSNVPQTETVVFDPIRWAEVSQRQQASFTSVTDLDSPENRAIAKKLDEQVLEHNFPSATVQDWSTYYGNLTGVTFVVGPDVAGMDAAASMDVDPAEAGEEIILFIPAPLRRQQCIDARVDPTASLHRARSNTACARDTASL
jgi:hypothetical protein